MATPSEPQYQAFFNVHAYRMFRQNIRWELSGSFEPHFSSKKQWSGGGSNSQPRHCERRALPVELPPRKKKLILYPSLPGLDRTNRLGGCLAEGMAVYNTESFHSLCFVRLFLYVCKPLQSSFVVPENTICGISLLAFRGADWFVFQESVDQEVEPCIRHALRRGTATLR